MRRDTLDETIRKLNLRIKGYREHSLKVAFARMTSAYEQKVFDHELMVNVPQSNYGPAANYDGPPTNIKGQMEAGVIQARLRERTQCYRLIIGRGWLMLVHKEDEAKWLSYSKQYWLGRDRSRSYRGETITGENY
jgi:hypothetical protein